MKATASDMGFVARLTRRLEDTLEPRQVDMWFRGSSKLQYLADDRRLQVSTPNTFVAKRIRQNFALILSQEAQAELGHPVEVEVCVEPQAFNHPAGQVQGRAGVESGSAERTGHARADERSPANGSPRRPGVNGRGGGEPRVSSPGLRHSLDNFVVGECNRLAFTVANRLIEDLGMQNRPLFIHGGCGLGKTHLLQGVCVKLQQTRPSCRVHYTTGEQFTNDFLEALRNNRLEGFRNKIRRIDLLAVDDVHFLANKPGTQQEFLHSFDAIGACGARIALASDSHPKLIKEFSDKLVSLCIGGMVAEVRPPDPATRGQIISRMASGRGLMLRDSALEHLTDLSAGSVREIEGRLNQLQALAELEARRQGLPNAQGLLIGQTLIERLVKAEQNARAKPWRNLTFADLVKLTAEHVGISSEKVLTSSRQKQVVLARSLAIYLARELTGMSYPELGQALGRSNHSTALTAYRRIAKQLQEDAQVDIPNQMEPLTLNELVQRIKRSARVGL